MVAAMVEGRRRWVERMKAEGRKFPGGRKAGADWVTPKMRARAPLAMPRPVVRNVDASQAAAIDELKREARHALSILEERFRRTGSLFER